MVISIRQIIYIIKIYVKPFSRISVDRSCNTIMWLMMFYVYYWSLLPCFFHCLEVNSPMISSCLHDRLMQHIYSLTFQCWTRIHCWHRFKWCCWSTSSCVASSPATRLLRYKRYSTTFEWLNNMIQVVESDARDSAGT